MTDWGLLGQTASGLRGFQMRGRDLIAKLSEADAVNGPVVRVGGGAADALPAKILPEQGLALPNYEQQSPPDVISGWVRLWAAGALANRENWDGVVCVTHGDLAHWMLVSADEVVSAQTTLTPRLVGALGGSGAINVEALNDTMSQPERLASHLRKAEVVGDRDAITGHFLGAELAATRPYWLRQEVLVIAEKPAALMQALEAQFVPCEALQPDELCAPGLVALAIKLGFAD